MIIILSTADAFIDSIDVLTLSRLGQMSRPSRAFFNHHLVWNRLLSRLLRLPAATFKDVGPTIDRLAVLQGLYCYTHRRDPLYAQTGAAHQKEIALWQEICFSKTLHEHIRAYCAAAGKIVEYPSDLLGSLFIKNASADRLRDHDRFRLIDSAHTIGDALRQTDFPVFVFRFPHSPLLQDDELTRLLPHERYHLQVLRGRNLCLYGCTFSSVSGWPEELPDVVEMKVVEPDLTQRHPWIWSSVPRMPGLAEFWPPPSLDTLVGITGAMPALRHLHLLECESLKTVEGLALDSGLETLTLPPSLECFGRSFESMNALVTLDMSKCQHLRSLAGLPRSLPMLQRLSFPPGLQSLEGMPESMDALVLLNMYGCRELKTLTGMTPGLAALQSLDFPESLETAEGMTASLPSLKFLNMSNCKQLATLAKMSRDMPVLQMLALPPTQSCFEELDPATLVLYPELRFLHIPKSFQPHPLAIAYVAGVKTLRPSICINYSSSFICIHH
ncbi:uncharacterized protein BJ171DRAFT_518895 [Polychytrium aggregatum]|uniref:uncharacterized protein n=1 Tax=Polychytrium aggregatum TaxID=110093 RepID=UPI0022FEFAEE|nr:uncharacterized protein BJ171DRAFT_518895 [Polychytrium aggregatum]KAI9199362.1 hypothetical protein BJ171DRAFT_518895 [Polychytrium aggregatum]